AITPESRGRHRQWPPERRRGADYGEGILFGRWKKNQDPRIRRRYRRRTSGRYELGSPSQVKAGVRCRRNGYSGQLVADVRRRRVRAGGFGEKNERAEC